MRRSVITIISLLVLAGGVVGCSGDSDEAATTTSAAVDFDVTTTLPPDEQAVVEACDLQIRAAGPSLAASEFPDHPDVQWTVIDVVTEVGLSFVEVEPMPVDGLKPSYRLVVECRDASEAVLFGVYELDGDTWTLLTTTDALGDAELPQTLG